VSVILLFMLPGEQFLAMGLIFIALGFFVYGPQLLIAVAAADFATKKAASAAVGLTGLSVQLATEMVFFMKTATNDSFVSHEETTFALPRNPLPGRFASKID